MRVLGCLLLRRMTVVAVPVVLLLALAASALMLRAQDPVKKTTLTNPAAFVERAPDTFSANFETSAGTFIIEVHRDRAPNGADRFYNLVKSGFYDGNRFFRVTPLMAVWGLNGDPAVARAWLSARIPDDQTHKHSNTKGAVAFFQANRRTTQTFINLVDNSSIMDIQIAPFGEVVSGMDVVEKLYAGYGEAKPNGNGPEMNPFYEERTTGLACRGFGHPPDSPESDLRTSVSRYLTKRTRRSSSPSRKGRPLRFQSISNNQVLF